MGIYLYYGIAHIGIVISILFNLYAIIRYVSIRKRMDVYLSSWILFVGIVVSAFTNFAIIFSDFVMKNKYEILDFKMYMAITYILINWLISYFCLIVCSNYYIKVCDDKLIIHSIWFSKIEIEKSKINKKESFQVMIDKDFAFDQYFIFKYEDKYLRIALDGLFQTMNNRKFINFYVGLRLKMINKKKEYSKFKKNTKIISAGRIFYNRKN